MVANDHSGISIERKGISDDAIVTFAITVGIDKPEHIEATINVSLSGNLDKRKSQSIGELEQEALEVLHDHVILLSDHLDNRSIRED